MRVEELGHESVHGRAEALHLARAERAGHQSAQPGVVRRIRHQHVVLGQLEELAASGPGAAEDVGRGVLDPHPASEPGVAQHGQALFVAVDDVGTERRPAHPRLLPHQRVARVGVGLALGCGQHLHQQCVQRRTRDDGHRTGTGEIPDSARGVMGRVTACLTCPAVIVGEASKESAGPVGARTRVLCSIESVMLRGKVVVVTGSNVGVGLETAVGVAALEATTVLACRNEAKAAAAAADVTRADVERRRPRRAVGPG